MFVRVFRRQLILQFVIAVEMVVIFFLRAEFFRHKLVAVRQIFFVRKHKHYAVMILRAKRNIAFQRLHELFRFFIVYVEIAPQPHRVETRFFAEFQFRFRRFQMLLSSERLPHIQAVNTVRWQKVGAAQPRLLCVPFVDFLFRPLSFHCCFSLLFRKHCALLFEIWALENKLRPFV